jgi:hypothetical protein
MNNQIHFCGDGITLSNRPLHSKSQKRVPKVNKRHQLPYIRLPSTRTSTPQSNQHGASLTKEETQKETITNTNLTDINNKTSTLCVQVVLDKPTFTVMNNVLTRCIDHTVFFLLFLFTFSLFSYRYSFKYHFEFSNEFVLGPCDLSC